MDCLSSEGVRLELGEEEVHGVESLSGRLGEISAAKSDGVASPGMRNDIGEGVSLESPDQGDMPLELDDVVDPIPIEEARIDGSQDELQPENPVVEVGSLERGNSMGHSVEVGNDSAQEAPSDISILAPVLPEEEECMDGWTEVGSSSECLSSSKSTDVESMSLDGGDRVHQFVQGEGNLHLQASNHCVQEDVSLDMDSKGDWHMEEGADPGQDSRVNNFRQETVLGEAGNSMGENLQSTKRENDVDEELSSSDQHQETIFMEVKSSIRTAEPVEIPSKTWTVQNSSRKNLTPVETIKTMDKNLRCKEMGSASHKSCSEFSENVGHKFLPGNKRGFDFIEEDLVVHNFPLNSHSFRPGDMVWGKVKSHPWWPGHIFNEAFASASVRRAKREGHLLVAFFGDSSYGWFDPDELIPFEPHFAEKSRQTSSRNFMKAVEEAVDEASRRCAVGVACFCRNPNTFRCIHVEGYFAIDVVDYEPGGVYSERQIKDARDSFKPVEFLSFVQQMALMPQSSEHRTIDGIKAVATILAYRRAVFVEFDETYAQAFGVDPVRPSQGTIQPPGESVRVPRAPLSGPLVIAESLTDKSASSKLAKSKHSKKDKYLFKRRDGPNDQKIVLMEESTFQHSEEEAQNSHSSGVENFIFQQRLPSLKEKPRIFPPKSEQQEQLGHEEKPQSLVEPKPSGGPASVGWATVGTPDKAMPGEKQQFSLVGMSDGWTTEKNVVSEGSSKASAKKLKQFHGEEKPTLVKSKHKQSEKKYKAESMVRAEAMNNYESKASGTQKKLVKKHSLTATVVPALKDSSSTPERSAAVSVIPLSDASNLQEGQAELTQMVDAQASVRPGASSETNALETDQSSALLIGSTGTTELEKANSLKRPLIANFKDSGIVDGIEDQVKKKKKKKKKSASWRLDAENNHLQKHADFHSSGMASEKVAKFSSFSSQISLIQQDLQGKDEGVGRDGLSVNSSVSFKSETGYSEQLGLRQLVNDLLFLALDPFHGTERNAPANVRQAFLSFRALVYQKSLVLPSADGVIRGLTQASSGVEASDKSVRHATGKAMPESGALDARTFGEELMSGRYQSSYLKTQTAKTEDIKTARKRSLSDQSDDVLVKKLKKLNDTKAAVSDKKLVQRMPEMNTTTTVKSSKLDPGRRPAAPVPRVPEPTAVNLKFPLGTSLPSEAQLKARFARFGPLDLAGMRIYYRSATCRVVFKYKSDARAAYDHVTRSGIFGQGVRYSLKEMNVTGAVSEVDSGKRPADDGSSVGQDDALPLRSGADAPGERRLLVPAQRQAPVTQLKSCLKKPASDDACGNVGIVKESPRVKFMLGGEESGRGEHSINGTSSADGLPVALDLNNNSKMVHLPPPPSLPPPPILPFPRETPQNHYQFNQVVESKSHIDISHQLLSLLLKCSDIVSNVKCTLGYVPYHPL